MNTPTVSDNRIEVTDDGTAWWVVNACGGPTCSLDWCETDVKRMDGPFDLTVERTFSVSVVTVLPIHRECPDESPADHVCMAWGDERWVQHRSFEHQDWTERQITLPRDARPGMWAVCLEVHQ